MSKHNMYLKNTVVTSDQSNLTQDRITDADGWFNRIHQVAPMCPQMWAHWRTLANMIELVIPSAHPSPQSERQIDRFSRFCTARNRKSLYFTISNPFPQNCPFSWGILTPSKSWLLGPVRAHNPNGITIGSASCTGDRRVSLYFTMGAPFPKKLPLPTGVSGSHLTYDSLGPFEPTTQTASRSVQLFLHRWLQSIPIIYNGTPLSPSKSPLSMGDLEPHLIHGSLGLLESSMQKASQSV